MKDALDFLLERMDFFLSSQKIAVFGASSGGEKTIKYLSLLSKKPVFFVDNDKKKWGKLLKGIPIYSPCRLLYETVDAVVIASSYGEEEIKLQLKNMGFHEKIYTLSEVTGYIVSKKLRTLLKNTNDINEIIEFAYNFRFLGVDIKPAQIRSEVSKLIRIVSKINPRVIVEIGTANGGTLFLWCRIASPNAVIVSVDLPGGEFGGGYPLWKVPVYSAFTKSDQKLFLIRGNSHDLDTLRKVKLLLGEQKVDFLFIDGDHTYNGIKADFEMYSPLVREGGIIALHDIAEQPLDVRSEVFKYWKKIKNRYGRCVEIVENREQGWAGIGVIVKEG